MVVESVPERLNIKREVFGELDRVADGDAILAVADLSLASPIGPARAEVARIVSVGPPRGCGDNAGRRAALRSSEQMTSSAPTPHDRRPIVVIGGGFGGAWTARLLGRAGVTIVTIMSPRYIYIP